MRLLDTVYTTHTPAIEAQNREACRAPFLLARALMIAGTERHGVPRLGYKKKEHGGNNPALVGMAGDKCGVHRERVGNHEPPERDTDLSPSAAPPTRCIPPSTTLGVVILRVECRNQFNSKA